MNCAMCGKQATEVWVYRKTGKLYRSRCAAHLDENDPVCAKDGKKWYRRLSTKEVALWEVHEA